MAGGVREFLVVVAATVLGTLAAQWLVNNNRTLRRAVGGI